MEALLESLEATLSQVERLISHSSAATESVTAVSEDLPERFTAEAPDRIAALRARLAALAERAQISRRRISKRRTVRGMLAAQLVRVEDVTPARLRNYGTLDPSFAELVSPALQQIQGELRALLDMVEE
jgi:hypothetical protein